MAIRLMARPAMVFMAAMSVAAIAGVIMTRHSVIIFLMDIAGNIIVVMVLMGIRTGTIMDSTVAMTAGTMVTIVTDRSVSPPV